MPDVLSVRGVARLRRFVKDRVLLAFDFDGTLAPIVPHPPDAMIRENTAALLGGLLAYFPVVVISGREVRDVRARLRGVQVPTIVGNHGVEPSPFMKQAEESVERWLAAVEALASDHAGVEVENKRQSLAIHFRHAASASVAEAAIRAVVDGLPGARVVSGLFVVNVVPEGAPHKGDALLRLMAEHHVDGTLFVGDDVTDEDAFGVLDPTHSIGIRIGRTKETAAQYFLQSQSHIDHLIGTLIAMRQEAALSTPAVSAS
ncbi:MAG: trehalose-phosphatase [Gemmatimonadaceae bacterium]